jgi:hypothetical protein
MEYVVVELEALARNRVGKCMVVFEWRGLLGIQLGFGSCRG